MSLSKTAFYLTLVLLPAAYVTGWGNGYGEPKIAAFMLLGAVCAASLARRLRQGDLIQVDAAAVCLAGLLLFQLAGAARAPNLGLALQSLAMTAGALAVAIYVYNADLDVIQANRMIQFSCAIPLLGAVAMILLRVSPFHYSPFGSTVGLKNSLSIYLAQCLPAFLILAHYLRPQLRSIRTRRLAAVFALMTLCLYVVLANRTRSAWWMAIVDGAVLLGLYAKTRQRYWRNLLLLLLSAAGLGLALLDAAPNALRWKTASPYWDSFSTLASPSRSSGREQLWTVAAGMAAAHPVLGVGAGNYAPLWREHVKRAAVDPRAFAFLRPDLPLFNDYLQTAVESGLPSLLFFAVFALGLPLLYLWRFQDQPTEITEVLLCLLCVSTSVNAFFDSPFTRPETLLPFVTSLALASKKIAKPVELPGPPAAWSLGAAIVAGALTLVLAQMSLGLSLRKAWTKNADPAALEWALFFWPWDCQWRNAHALALLDTGRESAAETLADKRLQAWPFDPESHLIKATVLNRARKTEEALSYYRKAVVQVERGRCYHPGYRDYLKMIGGPNPTASRLSDQELAACLSAP